MEDRKQPEDIFGVTIKRKMINSFQEISIFSGDDFRDHLGRISLDHIFDPLLKEYGYDPALCVKIIKYIAFGNSIESDKISVGGDRRKELHKIFRYLDIPNEGVDPKFLSIKRNYYEEIVLLSNDSVAESIIRWLKHKDNRQIEFLFTLQNAYVQQQAASLKEIRKSSGEVDYDQKFKCIGYMMDLKNKIKDAESELQQNDPKLKAAYEELKQAKQKAPVMGVENHAW